MELSALLTSAGINVAVCVVLSSLYSVLRKQPGNLSVYFGRRLTHVYPTRPNQHICFQRFVPSPSWIVKAWGTPEAEILAGAGVDAVVFLRLIVFSLRIFAVAAFVGVVLVLPVNYYGQAMRHKQIHSESLEVFTIANVKQGSKWLWTHCLALYIISFTACLLLYFEYKSIAKMRLAHIRTSPPNPRHFAVLVRGIPWSPDESYSDKVKKFFTKYHGASYLGHQMVYGRGTVQKLMADTEKMCKVLISDDFARTPSILRSALCTGPSSSSAFRILSKEPESIHGKPPFSDPAIASNAKEVPAAFVFFKTRYAADVAAEVLLSTNPMSWVTNYAPEPHDVYWKNLSIPFAQLWLRKIAILLTAIGFSVVFIAPVTFVQSLTELNRLQHKFPALRGLLEKNHMKQIFTGYLPSVILILFLYTVPPTMMLLARIEGSISRSGRKKSACHKVLYFMIWNVFFLNIVANNVIKYIENTLAKKAKDVPNELAQTVPAQATFFMTYVLTSGWASLSSELMQPMMLICNWFKRAILRRKDDLTAFSFPYHTEVPRVLLFGFLGFTFSVLAPLILPCLLVYFFLAFLVYRNQILNVYITKYESGGQLWPTVHNTTIFSLVFMQLIAMCVFGLKRSKTAVTFTFLLVICTILFNEYCRQRFYPVFKNTAAEILIEMDQEDEQSGRMEEIHRDLHKAYFQFTLISKQMGSSEHLSPPTPREEESVEAPIATRPGLVHQGK
ncbi:CSC1-like protein RXW8 [Punica granatum]|uniref:CSC1-like protein RXW8 n=1 Tax=Punica granatum TaxID=22663 RepID=A0A6P8DCI2_PUNGR|nr:CSC1-like protein RXW8 [Punica granatum]XP_031388981.1 CSC1-like protein RXW8 [Punica granatum]